MDQIKEIYDEYTRMRVAGVESAVALNALHRSVVLLGREERKLLAHRLSLWERSLFRTGKPQRELVADKRDQRKTDEDVWVYCSECGKLNQLHEYLCLRATAGITLWRARDTCLPDFHPAA